MRTRLILLSFLGLLATGLPAAAQYYSQTNLVSDEPGNAAHVDPNLINAWGLVSTATSPWWSANNGTLTSTLYDQNGVARALVVTVPEGPPTGVVANGGAGFIVRNGALAGPGRFIFATETGRIAGWNPAVHPTQAQLAVDNSAAGAVYKGLAITTTNDLLYAADFHNARVDVFTSAWVQVNTPGAFTDPNLPPGYAPFGIQTITFQGAQRVIVTYALQDSEGKDEVAGVGHGYVDAYDIAGNLLQRIASKARLNAPWGIALAPPTGFGAFSGALLIGNFGDGKINAFDLNAVPRGNGEAIQLGQLHSATGAPLKIDGLWALQFGHGNANSGPINALYFTAGPNDESNGLLGRIDPAPAPE
jgi:uncharacterized protein (TIGR03118 family)